MCIGRCLALPEELGEEGLPRFRACTEALWDTFDPATLWDVFGLLDDVTVSVLDNCVLPYTDHY